jgi:uncharacterized protein YggE
VVAVAAVGLLLIGAVASAALGRGVVAAAEPDDAATPSITVRGTGRVVMKPDTAMFSVGIEATAKRAGAAMDEASAKMAAIIERLRSDGVADADLTTTQISLTPTYDYGSGTTKPTLTGYSATQTLNVNARAIAEAGALIDASVDAGANQVGGIAFSVDDPADATDEARTAAVEDARRKADALARAAGVTLGTVIAISETGGEPPKPIFSERAVDSAGATPVQPGTTELSVDVEVSFAIG